MNPHFSKEAAGSARCEFMFFSKNVYNQFAGRGITQQDYKPFQALWLGSGHYSRDRHRNLFFCYCF